MNEYCAVSVDEMKQILVDPATLPYVPIHFEEEIKKSMEPLIKGVGRIEVNQLLSQLRFGKKELQSAYQSHNVDELKHLLNTIEPLISSLLYTTVYKQLTEDEQLDIEIITEEILKFRNYL